MAQAVIDVGITEIRRILLKQVAEWLECNNPTERVLNAIQTCVQENIVEWLSIIKRGVQYGIDCALAALRKIKDLVIEVCRPVRSLMKGVLKVGINPIMRNAIPTVVKKTVAKKVASEAAEQVIKVGAKQLTKQTTKGGTKTIVKQTVKQSSVSVVKGGTKKVVKQTVKQSSVSVVKQGSKAVVKTETKGTVKQIAKQGSKSLVTTGTKGTAKLTAVLSKAAQPVGILADIGQTGLECCGYKNTGRFVGVTGNIASGAMLGSVAGPPGAAVGALGGFVVWGVGEVIGELVASAFE